MNRGGWEGVGYPEVVGLNKSLIIAPLESLGY